MEFNPKKCEFLRITKRKQIIESIYYIGSCPIQEVPFIKYLGVTIDNQLTWNEHIKRITNKATSIKGFLQCNLSSCPIKVKLNCYKSLVRPILEYASIVWAPYTQLNINKVERIQRQAARFIYGDFSWHSSVSNMLHLLDLPTLSYRRDKAKIIFLYKIIHKLVDITPPVTYLRPISMNTRGHPLKYIQLPTSIDAYKHSFYPSAIKIWNNLSICVIESQSLEEFQTHLNNYNI